MKSSMFLLAGLAMIISSCSTTGALSSDPLSQRWVGKEAGKFFAAYGPPQSDQESGSSTIYIWKGGYKKRAIAAQYKGEGKDKKVVAKARTQFLSCSVRLTVGSDYIIKSISKIVDKQGIAGGPSWCEEYLDAAKAS